MHGSISCHSHSTNSIMVSMAAFQAVGPSSILGLCILLPVPFLKEEYSIHVIERKTPIVIIEITKTAWPSG